MPRYIPKLKTYVEPIKDKNGWHLPARPANILHEVVFEVGEEPKEGDLVTTECGEFVMFKPGEFHPGSFQCPRCVRLANLVERSVRRERDHAMFRNAFVDTSNEVAA